MARATPLEKVKHKWHNIFILWHKIMNLVVLDSSLENLTFQEASGDN